MQPVWSVIRKLSDKIGDTWAMANMNMIIHDVEGEMEIGDTFKNPKFRGKRGRLRTFDRVVANPMWNRPPLSSTSYSPCWNRQTESSMDVSAKKQQFKDRVYHWAEKLDVQVAWLGMRAMRNKWASCSTNGTLNFNTEGQLHSTPFRTHDSRIGWCPGEGAGASRGNPPRAPGCPS